MSGTSRRRNRAARIWVSLLALGRVLALVLGVQLSGAAHVASDVVTMVVAGHAEHEEQCPVDRPCNDCPPGCPNCHCGNVLSSVVTEPASPPVLTLPLIALVALDDVAQAPMGPERPSVFRPPRPELPVS